MKALSKTAAVAVLTLVAVPLFAQRQIPKAKSSVRLLNKSLGQSVAEAALNTNRWDYDGSDCSHFVNAIFEAVGLPFRYTNSFDLYDGTETFRRVFHPQPGDLIVWRGHVGIVVDPDAHSFYSMLRSGLRLSSYTSSYWKARGKARFLRYASRAHMAAQTVRVAGLHDEGQ